MSRARRGVAPAVLAGFLAVGVGLGWAALALWGLAATESFQRRAGDQQLDFNIDGTPMIKTWNGEQNRYVYRTLENEQLHNITQIATASLRTSADYERRHFDGHNWQHRLLGHSDENIPPNKWYLVLDGRQPGHAYFVGYSSVSKGLLGYIGSGGFQTVEPTRELCFPVDCAAVSGVRHFAALEYTRMYGFEPRGWSERPTSAPDLNAGVMYLISGDRLWAIDPGQRTARIVELPGRPEQIATFEPAQEERPPKPLRRLAVQTERDVLVLRREGEIVSTWTPPAEMPRDGWRFTLDTRGRAIYSWRDRERPELKHIAWADETGKILETREARIAEGDPREDRNVAAFFAGMIPAPGVLAGFPVFYASVRSVWPPKSFGEMCQDGVGLIWPGWLVVASISAALAWYVYCRQTRLYQPHAIGWALFVFLFGPAALLGYLTYRNWLPLRRCEACQAIVPHDRDACAKCASEFHLPAPLGVEVLA